jgi:6-phosphogluconolactonase (cycloisomerase 2 family)
MRTRFPWMAAILTLVAIAFLVACSTKYKSVSNGLVVVPTQASPVMQTFSLDLSNGHVSQINNVNGPPVPGLPGAVVLDPTGAFAYVIVNQNPTFPGVTGIVSFKVGSDGKLAAGTASPVFGSISPTVDVPCVTANSTTVSVSVLPTPVVPGSLAIDSAGKYLFVADVSTSGQTQPYQCNGATLTSTVAVPGAISVFSVSNGALTEVAGSPFVLPAEASGSGSSAASGSAASAAALAVTPTVFPVQFAACSGHTAPTTENLYVADSVSNVVLNYSVSSSGVLTLVPFSSTTPGAATGNTPSGVAVDGCGQFVYVANATSNSVSAFTICTAVSQNCPQADYSLQQVAGSPYPAGGDVPGPIAVDPFAKYVYVVDTGSSQLSGFRISPSTGSLTAIANTPIATASGANSIAIRSDGNWIFVANFNAASVSQYAITQATGALTLQSPFTTLNLPSGVAVK